MTQFNSPKYKGYLNLLNLAWSFIVVIIIVFNIILFLLVFLNPQEIQCRCPKIEQKLRLHRKIPPNIMNLINRMKNQPITTGNKNTDQQLSLNQKTSHQQPLQFQRQKHQQHVKAKEQQIRKLNEEFYRIINMLKQKGIAQKKKQQQQIKMKTCQPPKQKQGIVSYLKKVFGLSHQPQQASQNQKYMPLLKKTYSSLGMDEN